MVRTNPAPDSSPVVAVVTPHADKTEDSSKPDSLKQLGLGLLFGIMFGFLLQKGGVAKYDILIGSLLLTDFTVMKIMLTAIVVGMVGIFGMHALGLIQLHRSLRGMRQTSWAD